MLKEMKKSCLRWLGLEQKYFINAVLTNSDLIIWKEYKRIRVRQQTNLVVVKKNMINTGDGDHDVR